MHFTLFSAKNDTRERPKQTDQKLANSIERATFLFFFRSLRSDSGHVRFFLTLLLTVTIPSFPTAIHFTFETLLFRRLRRANAASAARRRPENSGGNEEQAPDNGNGNGDSSSNASPISRPSWYHREMNQRRSHEVPVGGYRRFLVLDVEATCVADKSVEWPNEIIVSRSSSGVVAPPLFFFVLVEAILRSCEMLQCRKRWHWRSETTGSTPRGRCDVDREGADSDGLRGKRALAICKQAQALFRKQGCATRT